MPSLLLLLCQHYSATHYSLGFSLAAFRVPASLGYLSTPLLRCCLCNIIFFPDDILLIPIFCSSWSGTESAASWSQESVEQKRTRLLLFFYLAIRVSDQYQAQNKLRMVSRVSRRSSIHAALCFILYSSSTQDSHVEVLKRSSPSTVSSKAFVVQSVHVIDVELFIPEVWSVLTCGSCSCFFSVPD